MFSPRKYLCSTLTAKPLLTLIRLMILQSTFGRVSLWLTLITLRFSQIAVVVICHGHFTRSSICGIGTFIGLARRCEKKWHGGYRCRNLNRPLAQRFVE